MPKESSEELNKAEKLLHPLIKSGEGLSRTEEIRLEIELLDKRKQFDIEIKREEIRLQEEIRQNSFRRQTQLIRQISVNVVGVFFIGAGVFFTQGQNMLGSFMISLGAGAVGINTRDAASSTKTLFSKTEGEEGN